VLSLSEYLSTTESSRCNSAEGRTFKASAGWLNTFKYVHTSTITLVIDFTSIRKGSRRI
jgi:hypothetical protein